MKRHFFQSWLHISFLCHLVTFCSVAIWVAAEKGERCEQGRGISPWGFLPFSIRSRREKGTIRSSSSSSGLVSIAYWREREREHTGSLLLEMSGSHFSVGLIVVEEKGRGKSVFWFPFQYIFKKNGKVTFGYRFLAFSNCSWIFLFFSPPPHLPSLSYLLRH